MRRSCFDLLRFRSFCIAVGMARLVVGGTLIDGAVGVTAVLVDGDL